MQDLTAGCSACFLFGSLAGASVPVIFWGVWHLAGAIRSVTDTPSTSTPSTEPSPIEIGADRVRTGCTARRWAVDFLRCPICLTNLRLDRELGQVRLGGRKPCGSG